MLSDRRICEYFVITGSANERKPYDLSQIYNNTEEIFKTNIEIEEDLFKFKEPVVDIQLVNLTQKERVPDGFHIVDRSYSKQNKADLYGKSSLDELYLCFRCGRDKPPITDIWAGNPKQKTLSSNQQSSSGWKFLDTTISGKYPANLHSSVSNALYICYRRASLDASVDSLAVTDICVILTNRNEQCPPAYTRLDVPIKRAALSHTINICYKKSLIKQHVLTYRPDTLFCLPATSIQPIVDECNPKPELVRPSSCLPPEIRDVANFCMPWGATIEAWSNDRKQPKPSLLTFVLTDEKYNRMYGSAVQFYDEVSIDELTDEERSNLQLPAIGSEAMSKIGVYAGKSICLLSRSSSLTQTFNQVLLFLLQEYQRQCNNTSTDSCPFNLPLERYLSQFMHAVPFPTLETPNILLHWDIESPIAIHLPHNALSQFGSGENLYHLIRLLDVDQVIQLFVYMLTEQKILLTSTCNSDLTGIAEALLAIIFPFRWSVTYIPFLYLSCIHIIQSPSPYLIGVDSRFFDYFQLPEGVGCVDLVTKSIKPPDDCCKHLEFTKVLPKAVLKALRTGLGSLKNKVSQFEKEQMLRRNNDNMIDEISVLRKREKIGEMIRDCFLKANISMFKNYQSELIPLDMRDSDDMFQADRFLKSVDKNSRPLYQAIFDTQLWNNFILTRSQSTKFDDSLVFFDRCIKRMQEIDEDRAYAITLIHNDSIIINSEHTRVVEPLNPPENWSPVTSPAPHPHRFPDSLDTSLMLTTTIHSSDNEENSLNFLNNTGSNSDSLLNHQDQSITITNNNLKLDSTFQHNRSSSNTHLDVGTGSDYRGSNNNLDVSSIPTLMIRPESNDFSRIRRSSGISILKRPLEELKQARQMAYDAKQQILAGVPPQHFHNMMTSNNQHVWANQLLASSYCLWFLTLPGLVGHILDTPGLGETGLADRILQLAMELLGGLFVHKISLPDEVCCRILMLLIHQLRPVHFRAADLRKYTSLNAFTYGLCNQITLEENQEQINHKIDYGNDNENVSTNEDYIIMSTDITDKSNNNVNENKEIIDDKCDEKDGGNKDDKPNDRDCDSGRETIASSEKEQQPIKNETQSYSPSNEKQPSTINTTSAVSSNKKRLMDSSEIEIGGKIVKLRGKKQSLGLMKEGRRKRDRYSVMMFQPSSGNGMLIPGTRVSAAGDNSNNIDEDNSNIVGQNYNFQIVNKSAGLLISSTNKTPENLLSNNFNSYINPPPKLKMYPSSPDPNSTSESQVKSSIQITNKSESTSTNPMRPAMIYKSPFSEERSEIHHAFLINNKQKSQATTIVEEQRTDPSASISPSSPSEIVNDVIESLKECDVSSKSSEMGYSTGTDERLIQSEFGSGNIANKTRASFRQMKSVANRSLRSMKNMMGGVIGSSSSGGGSGFSWSTDQPIKTRPTSTNQPGGGLPATYRPWDNSIGGGMRRNTSALSSGTNSINNQDRDRRVTGSVDLLDRLSGGSGTPKPETISHPGLATVQQTRRQRPGTNSIHQYDSRAYSHQYPATAPGPLSQYWKLQHGSGMLSVDTIANSNSCESIHSDKSVSNASLESEYIVINLDKAWERITGSLSAVLLPTGKYWSYDTNNNNISGSSVSPITEAVPQNDSKESSPRDYVTCECVSSLSVNITTSTECTTCHQIIYDDIIMDSWSWEDSDLCATCFYCNKSFTPKLDFQVYIKVPQTNSRAPNTSSSSSSSPTQTSPTHVQPIMYRDVLAYQYQVNYLSPFVLRKELERVLEKEGESALLRQDFLSQHDILYWNLLWFFSRLALPSQLPSYLTFWLKQRGEALAGQSIENRLKYQILLDLTGYEKVTVNTYWEFSKLNSKIAPSISKQWNIYRQMIHIGAPMNYQLIVTGDVVKQILHCFHQNDMKGAIVSLLEQRKLRWQATITLNNNNNNNTQSQQPTDSQQIQILQFERSLYRELYFLLLSFSDGQIVNLEAFHQSFYFVWPEILKRYRVFIGPQDKPPTQSILYCRKVFRNLAIDYL